MKSVLVYKSPQVRVVEGANVGDELTFARELFLDDTYMLEPLARRERLSVRFETDGLFVGKKGEVGQKRPKALCRLLRDLYVRTRTNC